MLQLAAMNKEYSPSTVSTSSCKQLSSHKRGCIKAYYTAYHRAGHSLHALSMLARWPVPPSSSGDHMRKQCLASSAAQWMKAAAREAEGLSGTEDRDYCLSKCTHRDSSLSSTLLTMQQLPRCTLKFTNPSIPILTVTGT